MPLRWFATAPISFFGVRAFNAGDYVHDSLVTDHGLAALGLVTQVNVPGQDPAAVLRPLTTADRDTDAEREAFIPARLAPSKILTASQVAAAPELRAAYVAVDTPTLLMASRTALFIGDSYTAGSNGAAGRRFVDYVPFLAGTECIASVATAGAATDASVVAGYPGTTSAGLLGNLPGLLTTRPGVVVCLIGVNDVKQSVPLATFQSNIQAIATLCRKAGAALVLGTVPAIPTAGATSTTRTLTAAYNLWLRLWAASAGVYLADTYGATADPTTGDMLPAYATTDAGAAGDGVHPNSAGHYAIAKAFAAALATALPINQPAIVRAKTSPVGYNTNPLMAGAGTKPTGAFENGGGTGTAPTYSLVTDADGTRWARMDFDATAAGGTRTLALPLTGSFTAGDRGLFAGRVRVVDLGGYKAGAALPVSTASWTLQIVDSTTGVGFQVVSPVSMPDSPGPLAQKFISAAAHTNPVVWFTCKLPTGARAQFDIAMLDVFNLTTLGLA